MTGPNVSNIQRLHCALLLVSTIIMSGDYYYINTLPLSPPSPILHCRADIKQYIGMPTLSAVYKIYHTCIKELMRVGGLRPPDL